MEGGKKSCLIKRRRMRERQIGSWRLISTFLYCPLPISFYDTEEVEGEKRMGNFGERCSSCNFDGKFPRGGESRKLGAQKKCVYAALCSSVLADGMGNGRIAWDPRERVGMRKNKHQSYGTSTSLSCCKTLTFHLDQWGRS